MQRFDMIVSGRAPSPLALARILETGWFRPVEAPLDGLGVGPGDIVLADVGWDIFEASQMIVVSGTDLTTRQDPHDDHRGQGVTLRLDSGTVTGLTYFTQPATFSSEGEFNPIPEGVTPPYVFDPALVGLSLSLTLAEPVAVADLNDTLTTGLIPRSIAGTDGDDRLVGGLGDDTLAGGAGDDILSGGPGNTLFLPGAGADTLFGRGGQDTISYADQSSGVLLDLRDALTVQGAFHSLEGSPYDDRLTLGQGVRRLFGGDGDDRLNGGMGVKLIDGGSGSDTAVFTSASSEARLMALAGGRIGVLTPDEGLTLVDNVEALAFSDTTLVPDVLTTRAFLLRDAADDPLLEGMHSGRGTSAAEVVFDSNPAQRDTLWGGGGRDVIVTETMDVTADPKVTASFWSYGFYKALLGRLPNAGEVAPFYATDGITFGFEDRITDILTHGAFRTGPLADLLEQTTIGNSTFRSADMDFLEAAFRNLLGRDMTEAGRAVWAEYVGAGRSAESLVETLVSTATPELRARFANDLATLNERMDHSAMLDDLFRLYETAFGRLPDVDGLQHWLHRLTGNASLEQVATGFVTGAEFIVRFGVESDAAFIETLYQNALGRTADAGGLAHWAARLEAGMSRGDLALGIANSPEMRRATDTALDAWVRAQGTDDMILVQMTDIDRFGLMTLNGGAWSDTFVFTPAENPEHNGYHTANVRIGDLERWDVIDLTAFGFADHDTLWRALSEDGGALVLDAGALRLTLIGLSPQDLHADMILI